MRAKKLYAATDDLTNSRKHVAAMIILNAKAPVHYTTLVATEIIWSSAIPTATLSKIGCGPSLRYQRPWSEVRPCSRYPRQRGRRQLGCSPCQSHRWRWFHRCSTRSSKSPVIAMRMPGPPPSSVSGSHMCSRWQASNHERISVDCSMPGVRLARQREHINWSSWQPRGGGREGFAADSNA